MTAFIYFIIEIAKREKNGIRVTLSYGFSMNEIQE